ncbi:type II toxin-antitoxin system death-on-curing family toxin [Fibrella aestuarina]|uniref:type II toxin-antitoxin system death-on-curing family toxin n=1 Tax=Fibrella aestuarina TaxID=651143 RepID=UPI00068534B1|nr:type II toxin-antitoxin system death-on-curing family toxin [Fibrella aestuarina]
MYPSVADKAAVYCYTIICNHVFSDGNKRTGLGSALNFLLVLANGWQIKLSVQPDTVTSYILDLASGQSSLEACWAWFAANAVPL